MVYIVADTEKEPTYNPSNMAEIFENSNDEDYWDLAPEGTGMEACCEDEDLFDWEENRAKFKAGFKHIKKQFQTSQDLK